MDKDRRADKETAAAAEEEEEQEEEEEEEEKHTQYLKKAEQKPEEEQEAQKKHAISEPSPPTTRSPPPQSHRYHKTSSAPLDSSSPSSLSSDHSSHSHELKRSAAPAPDTTPPAVVANRSFWTNTVVVLDKVDPGAQDGFTSVREVEAGSNSRGGTDGGGGSRRLRPNLSILRRMRRDNMVKKALLWLRISAFVFCMISFSVMVADKNQGWALDSFQRYKEFRYCMAVNVVGFAYSGLQAYDLVNYFSNGKQIVWHNFRYYFDFSMDQVVHRFHLWPQTKTANSIHTMIDHDLTSWLALHHFAMVPCACNSPLLPALLPYQPASTGSDTISHICNSPRLPALLPYQPASTGSDTISQSVTARIYRLCYHIIIIELSYQS